MPLDAPAIQLLNSAWDALGAMPGWSAYLPGDPGRPDYGCHDDAAVLVYVVPSWDIEVVVCQTCLQAHVRVGGTVFGPPARQRWTGPTRACRECNRELPLPDFVARTGSITVYCTSCRTKWARNKRAQEEAKEAAEAAEAARQEALMNRTKGALVGRLRQIEQELTEVD